MQESRCLFLNGGDDSRMRMPGCADGDAGIEIEKTIAVDIFQNRTLTPLHDERINPCI